LWFTVITADGVLYISRCANHLQLTAVRFFFSSRRRHTRSDRDWSSDVCSSDLPFIGRIPGSLAGGRGLWVAGAGVLAIIAALVRSEERRVGKECRSPRCRNT